MAYSALTDLNTGQVLTAAIWQQLVDNDAYWKDRVDNPARAVVLHNTTQSIATSTATAVVWNTETSDSASIHSTSVNTSRATIPSGEGGTYIIVGYLDWAANATGIRQAYIRLNGTTVLTNEMDNAVAGGGTTPQVVTAVYPLAATDYVEIIGNQTSGGALNINANSRMMIVRVA